MSKSDSTGKPLRCEGEDCGKELDIFGILFVCADGKVRCSKCFRKWSNMRSAM